MSSITGYIAYLQYTYGSNKGATTAGTVINEPFKLGDYDVTYTSSKVAETVVAVADGTAGTHTSVTVNWTPILNATGSVVCKVGGVEKTPSSIDYENGIIKFAIADVAVGASVAVLYVYDNVKVPQNDIPLINAKMSSITLEAKARRVAVYFSQIANYQA